MKISRVALLVMVFAASGCDRPDPAAFDPVAEATQIMKRDLEWLEALRANDVDAVMSFMATEPRLIMPGVPPIAGREPVRAVVQEMVEDDIDYAWEPDGAVVAPSGDMAYSYGKSYIEQPDGAVAEGKYMVVWVREDGEWKVAVDMAN